MMREAPAPASARRQLLINNRYDNPTKTCSRPATVVTPGDFAPVRPRDAIARRNTMRPVRRGDPSRIRTLRVEPLSPTASLQTATFRARRRNVREAFACQFTLGYPCNHWADPNKFFARNARPGPRQFSCQRVDDGQWGSR